MVCRYTHAECTYQHAASPPEDFHGCLQHRWLLSSSKLLANLLCQGFCVWGVAFDLGHSTDRAHVLA